MRKALLVLVLLVAALGAAAALVPLRGATVLERWAVAPSARAFAERGWAELRSSVLGGPAPQASRSRPARRGAADRTRARAVVPREELTASDRAELDRIVAERAGR